MSTITQDDVMHYIENMTVLELSEFVKKLEDRFGVTAAAPVAVAAAAPSSAAPKDTNSPCTTTIL